MRKVILFICTICFISCSSTSEKQPNNKSQNDNVEIVNNSAPKHSGQFWDISENPELVIGVAEGAKEYQFYRVFDVIQLQNDKIIVSNSGTHQLRVFNSEGDHIKSFGRKGKGPGEFGEWSSMRIYRIGPDSIAVNDSNNERINIFDTAGNYKNSLRVEPIDGAGNPTIMDIFSNNDWLVWSTVGDATLQGRPGSLIQKEYGFYRLKSQGEYSKRMFTAPARPRYVNEGNPSYPYIPLTAETLYITDGNNGILYSPGDKSEIIRYDKSANHRYTFKWDVPRQKVSEIWNRYKENYLSDIPQNRRSGYVKFLEKDLPLPKETPSIEKLIRDHNDNIWIKRFKLPWDNKSEWDILTSSGDWLGTLSLPSNLTITEIGQDYILGTTKDRKGIQRIVKYGLNRNE